MIMKLKSLSNYKQPVYPTRDKYILQPMLLNDCLPPSWGRKAVVAGALLAFVMAGSAGADLLSLKNKAGVEILRSVESYHALLPTGMNLPEYFGSLKDDNGGNEEETKISPLFIHGKGAGSIGCVVISPPAFLSEADAKRIIEDEFRNAGIGFDFENYQPDGLTVGKEQIFRTEEDREYYESTKGEDVDDNIPLVMNGYNREYNFGYCYVGTTEHDKYSENHSFTSLDSWHTKETAERIVDILKSDGRTNAAVFYEPMNELDYRNYRNSQEPPLKVMEMVRSDAEEESKKLLRYQVQDFLEWARAEGVLEKI